MQTVGKLDQNNTDILCHGEEHLTQVLRLYLDSIRRVAQLSQLGYAGNDQSNLSAEFAGDILFTHRRIFDHIMQ